MAVITHLMVLVFRPEPFLKLTTHHQGTSSNK